MIVSTIKIAENAVNIYRYYIATGVHEVKARKLSNGYFENAIRDRQDKVIEEVLKEKL